MTCQSGVDRHQDFTSHMNHPFVIATQSKHLASLMERSAKHAGLSCLFVEPTATAVFAQAGKTQACVVVIDALQNSTDALTLVQQLAESRPRVKSVILGKNPDVGLVAKSIAAGASHFLLESMSAEDAIKQCDQFGFAVDEIAKRLKLPIVDVERATKKSRGLVKSSFFPQGLGQVIPTGSGDGLLSANAWKGVLATLVVLAAALIAVNTVPAKPSLDNFVTIKGSVAYEDGTPLGNDTVLIFGLRSRDGKASPSYLGATAVENSAGSFSAVLRLSHDEQPPFSLSIAITNKARLPPESKILAQPYSDLATTPLLITTSGEEIDVRCPKPR